MLQTPFQPATPALPGAALSPAALEEAARLRRRFGPTAELFCDAALESSEASDQQRRTLRLVRQALVAAPWACEV